MLTSSRECGVDRRETLFIALGSEVRARAGSVIASLLFKISPATGARPPVLHLTASAARHIRPAPLHYACCHQAPQASNSQR